MEINIRHLENLYPDAFLFCKKEGKMGNVNLVFVILLGLLIFIQRIVINTKELENDQLKKDLSHYMYRLSTYENICAKCRVSSKTNQNIPQKEMVEVAKYAMIRSHPDNGGNTEDFIKYKKYYGKLTGK